MVRKLVVVFTSVVLFAAAHVKALGLGEIVVESALNQPLAARIDLLQLGSVRPDQITVQLASENDFARFSIDRESFLNSIRFNVETAGNSSYVRLTTASEVREPYLSFVLETSWPSGRLLSEHTVLLDLPSFAANAQPAPIQQAVQVQQSPSQNSVDNQNNAPQSSASSAGSPARLAAPAEPAAPTAVEVAPEEEVTSSSDFDSVVEDTASPAADGPAAAPAPEVSVPQPVQEPAQTPLATTSDTISIGADDTLWDVALQIRPDSSVSVQQTMLALQRLNSEAFISDNINMVRRGQVLRVPDIDQIRALSAREAISEVSRQNQLFENRSNVPLTSQPVAAQPSVVPADTPARRGELSVVTIDSPDSAAAQSASGGQSAELNARITSLENELAVQQEEADRVALQNRELADRLGLLEQQIASAQQIVRLRDLELAQLQQTLAQAESEEIEPVDPPTVITMAPERSFVQTVLDTLIENTYALLAVTALIILMLVYVLLRRNKANEEEALADMDGMADDSGRVAAAGAHSEFTSNRESRSAEGDADLEEIFDLADEADEVMSAEGFISTGIEDVDAAHEILEQADTLIAHQHYDEATALLQDAIVAEPDRTDLRLKLLEVCVARQDAIGFKLQETELRDLGGVGVAARIAELKSQLRRELDDEILEEGEDDFFSELSALDDMEVALDLEASADVDDARVRSGYSVETEAFDTRTAEAVAQESLEPEEEDAIDFDFDLPEPDTSTPSATTPSATNESALDADLHLMDFDTLEESTASAPLSPAFDLADDEPAAKFPDHEEEKEENLLDFDFDFAVEEESGADVAKPEMAEPEITEDDPEHSIDFDFAVLDDEKNSPSPVTSGGKVDDEIEFELGEDTELATVDVQDDNFRFDSSEFDLDVVEDDELDGAEVKTTDDDDLAGLRFVDDEALEQASALNAEDAAEDDEFEFLSDADEAATKLDLAQAYFEMGDYDGAREILEEVIEEGTDAQIKDARTLLDKL